MNREGCFLVYLVLLLIIGICASTEEEEVGTILSYRIKLTIRTLLVSLSFSWYYMYWSSTHAGVTVVSIAKDGGAVHENDTIMITCCAYNGLADGFEWARLDGPAEIPSKAVGVNSSTLLIPNASLDDLGLYACSSSSLQTNQSDPVQIVFTGGLYGKLLLACRWKYRECVTVNQCDCSFQHVCTCCRSTVTSNTSLYG